MPHLSSEPLPFHTLGGCSIVVHVAVAEVEISEIKEDNIISPRCNTVMTRDQEQAGSVITLQNEWLHFLPMHFSNSTEYDSISD